MVSAKLHENENVKVGAGAVRVRNTAIAVGIVSLLGAVLLGGRVDDGWSRFLHSYLWNFTYFLSFALGALFFVILQHLVKAYWSVTVRRVAECLMAPLPVLMVMSLVFLIPLWFDNDGLYLWSDGQLMESDHLLHNKVAWLNEPFFVVRVLIYFLIWGAMAHFFARESAAQDESGDIIHTDRMRRASGPAMIVFALSLSAGAFDLLMSLEPRWFSTIFGVYYFAGCAISIMALLVLVPRILQSRGVVEHSITVEHYHDVGKLLFAFVFFWGYIAFSQFMLIWMANMPEETGWYMLRMELGTEEARGYGWISLALLIFHFAVPFVCLLSRWTKRLNVQLGGRKVPILALFAVWMLLMHWVDLYYLSMPSYHLHHYDTAWLIFHPIDVLNLVGIGGLFVAAVAHRMRGVNLIPTKDPSLGASLRFENQ